MSFLSPERLSVVYQNSPANARKKLLFFKKFSIPYKRPFTAKKGQLATDKHRLTQIKKHPEG
jgi:hypothetical protein